MTSDHGPPDQGHPDQRQPDQRGTALPAGLTTRPANIIGDSADDLPGDPACLLRRVCQTCGGVADSDPPTTCPHCGADLPGA